MILDIYFRIQVSVISIHGIPKPSKFNKFLSAFGLSIIINKTKNLHCFFYLFRFINELFNFFILLTLKANLQFAMHQKLIMIVFCNHVTKKLADE